MTMTVILKFGRVCNGGNCSQKRIIKLHNYY